MPYWEAKRYVSKRQTAHIQGPKTPPKGRFEGILPSILTHSEAELRHTQCPTRLTSTTYTNRREVSPFAGESEAGQKRAILGSIVVDIFQQALQLNPNRPLAAKTTFSLDCWLFIRLPHCCRHLAFRFSRCSPLHPSPKPSFSHYRETGEGLATARNLTEV